MSGKHFLNDPATLVLDSLHGLCALNPHLALDAQNTTVYLKNHDRSKVALMCGGGSGHEPAHAAFVGEGMLTSAVCGNIFASPNASQVRRGIDLIDNDKGTVIIVKNYTGDVLNFGLAKEQYASLHPDRAAQVKFVIVGDDVAVGRAQGKIVGRRGLAGTVLVYKIAGALAHRGGSLDEVYNIAQWVASNVATIGVSLGHTHVPGTAAPTATLSPSELEIGLGIHNERGHSRVSPVPPLSALLPQLFDFLTSTTDPGRSFVPFTVKDSVVLLVNNLGGVSELELGGVVHAARTALEDRGFVVARVLAGTFMTSLNMPGFSITLLRLPSSSEPTPAPGADLLLSLLDDTPQAPGWKWSAAAAPLPASLVAPAQQTEPSPATATAPLAAPDPRAFIASVTRAAHGLITAEPEITRMDAIAGDGDCGLTLKAGAEGVLEKVADGSIDGNDVVRSVITVARIAEVKMGGTSGALYSIFFSALAQSLQSPTSPTPTAATPDVWASALASALAKLYTYTRARPPSRTLVDPLAAFVDALSKDPTQLGAAVSAAAAAAEATKDMEAKAGRSAYVEGTRLKDEQVPDPGAWGIKTILEGVSATGA